MANYFMALGGAQSVGCSCYYLQLDGADILLDAGARQQGGATVAPDLLPLSLSPMLESLSQVSAIYISHAHYDHVGALPQVAGMAPYANILMTELTYVLSEYQLCDRQTQRRRDRRGLEGLQRRSILDRVSYVSYMQPRKFGSYQAEFFPAGHLPGAMMTLFRAGRQNILYTGDYSGSPTALAGAYMLPEDLRVDVLLLCGLHAKHGGKAGTEQDLLELADSLLWRAARGEFLCCHLPQLSKGVEFLKLLTERNIGHVPIFLDETVTRVVRKLEQLQVPLLTGDVRTGACGHGAGIMLSAQAEASGTGSRVEVDFTLHDDFYETLAFVRRLNPRYAYIVHSPGFDTGTFETELLRDGDCRTQLIWPEEGELYKL